MVVGNDSTHSLHIMPLFLHYYIILPGSCQHTVSACLCFHLSVDCVVPPLPPLQAYRHNPPYFPINEFGLLFSIIGGTLGIGVAVAVGILFAVHAGERAGWKCVC